MKHRRSHVRTVIAGLATLGLASVALADPPPPPENPTICPTVQCMRVTNFTDNFDGTFDVQIQAFNWFNTNPDTGVNTLLFFTGNLRSKVCTDGMTLFDTQVDVIGASAPAGWTVVQADNEKVEFSTTSTASEIADLDLCDPSVTGGCINGGGPGISTCGNDQDGFVITLQPGVPVGDLCSWTANWRNLDEFGLDNGDVMNFGSLSYTFGSIVEAYSNNPYPPSSFSQNSVDDCAKKVQKKAGKYAQTRLKQYAKCFDKVNKGQTCDEAKRDDKVDRAKTKLEEAIDDTCSDNQVANVGWCGTTVANLKTCLVSQLDSQTDQALATIYGP
jgi:hypothetical protein